MSTVLEAIVQFPEWHADVPFDGSTKDYALDMKLADAFRAVLYRKSTPERLRWIEREVYNPTNGALTPYQTELARWWQDLHRDLYYPNNDNTKV